MYQYNNEQFAAGARQFADVFAQINRLALDNAEKAFALQMATLEENTNAAFAYFGELVEARDFEDLKAAWPKGVQIARENVERAIGTQQEVLGHTLKANESIAQIAKGQFEQATAEAQAQVEKVTAKAKAEVEKATKAATRAAK
ncbi:MAG: phasin family protein [Pseudoxanthomonas suwonensis]|nr:phasin family protein [Pseudoxanthomonas suwonensis]